MAVRFGENSTCLRPVQPANALSPILMTESGMTMLVRLLHFRNARLLILVTEFGIVTLVRLLQLSNALSLILVTESGIVTLVRLLHFAMHPFFQKQR